MRLLRRSPGFAAATILTLALSVGANAAIFSAVEGVLIAPLPYREPDRLVQIWETNPLMNWTTATRILRPQARVITPQAALDLPLP